MTSRAKGVRGEREVADLWTAAGATVRGLEAAGDHLVITANGLVLHSEVKRQERLKIPEWIRQLEADAPAGTLPVLAFRQNRGRWYAVVDLERLARLVTR